MAEILHHYARARMENTKPRITTVKVAIVNALLVAKARATVISVPKTEP